MCNSDWKEEEEGEMKREGTDRETKGDTRFHGGTQIREISVGVGKDPKRVRCEVGVSMR